MAFQWQAPEAKKKGKGKPADETPASAAPSVAEQGVKVEAVISRLRTMADGGLRVELDLPELEPAMFALLYALRNKAVSLTIQDKK